MNILKKTTSSILFLLLVNLLYSQTIDVGETADGKEFRASVVKVDITPENSQYLLGYGAYSGRKFTPHSGQSLHPIPG
jgi:hypothetical protein